MNGLNQCGSQFSGSPGPSIGTFQLTGVGQSRKLEIPESIDDLARQVDTLREIVACLGNRLEPVLGGGSTNQCSDTKQDPPAAGLAAAIAHNANEVRTARRLLELLIDRLEL